MSSDIPTFTRSEISPHWRCSIANSQKSSRHAFGDALLFCFTAIVLKSSRLNRLRPSGAGDPLTGSLYVASLIREENVRLIWDRRSESLTKLDWTWHDSDVRVLLGSATDLSHIPTETVDYIFTDPPFGGNLYYADASLLWESWLRHFTDG